MRRTLRDTRVLIKEFSQNQAIQKFHLTTETDYLEDRLRNIQESHLFQIGKNVQTSNFFNLNISTVIWPKDSLKITLFLSARRHPSVIEEKQI